MNCYSKGKNDNQGHPTTVFCKISIRKSNIAQNFLSLEEGQKFLDNRSIYVQFSKFI